ncbi:MAG: Anaphase-promoting complex subunit 1 [Caeruleum heppii]|nr:MAG: Anaphase-promoting complex subunit 1 [Caeruleum heppii]
MASVTSLGLHEPSGLPQLIADSVLPSDPKPDAYTWITTTDHGAVEEELLYTHHAVVWSRNGLVNRVFRFDVEGESVTHAVLTWFPKNDRGQGMRRHDRQRVSVGSDSNLPKSQHQHRHGDPADPAKQPHKGPKHQSENIQTGIDTKNGSQVPSSGTRALVVFLRTQAHVYYLTGPSHVVHLPFEVDHVLAAPCGLIIQRKLPSLAPNPLSPRPCVAPPNSFVSSQVFPMAASRSSFLHPEASLDFSPSTFMPRGFSISSKAVQNLPRTYTLLDPLFEMGLVVSSSSDSSQVWSDRGFGTLPAAENLIYISSPTELSALRPTIPSKSLVLALTFNQQSMTYSVWRVHVPTVQGTQTTASSRTAGTKPTNSRRRSSRAPRAGTGTVTPAAYATTGGRESLIDGLWGSDAAGMPETTAEGRGRKDHDVVPGVPNQLSAALQPDLSFDQRGPPAKESRRVSSLLARADLSTTQDRAAFSDLATGHSMISGPAHAAQSRRGDSLGSYPDPARHGNPRRSVPSQNLHTAGPRTSQITVCDAEDDEIMSDPVVAINMEKQDGLGMQTDADGLRKEAFLTRLATFPHQQPPTTITTGSSLASKVFTLSTPQPHSLNDGDPITLLMCVVDKASEKMVVLTFPIKAVSASRSKTRDPRLDTVGPDVAEEQLAIGTPETKTVSGVLDAVKIVDGHTSRILILNESPDGPGELNLQSPWTDLYTIQFPTRLIVLDPYVTGRLSTPRKKREGGLRRVLSQGPRRLVGLEHEGLYGAVDVRDDEGRRHRLQIQMQPRDREIARMLDICSFVLPGKNKAGAGVTVAWWNIRAWLSHGEGPLEEQEWRAFVIAIMMMAVGYTDTQDELPPLKQKKQRGGKMNSGNGASSDSESWTKMLCIESGEGVPVSAWMGSPAWAWVADQEESGMKQQDQQRLSRPSHSARHLALPRTSPISNGKSTFLMTCIAQARTYMSTTSGQASATALPTGPGRGAEVRRVALATILVALHLYREELKLDIASADAEDCGVRRLTPLLAQLGGWLGWGGWGFREPAYYNTEDVAIDRWVFDEGMGSRTKSLQSFINASKGTISTLSVPPEPFEPPSIYGWLSECTRSASPKSFMMLRDIVPTSNDSSHPALAVEWASLTPRSVTLTELFLRIIAFRQCPTAVVEAMAQLRINAEFLESLPEGIAFPLREAIVVCQSNPPTTWSQAELNLIRRDDLITLLSPDMPHKEQTKSQAVPTHEAARDVHSICHSTFESENIGSFDGSAEQDRQSVTRLIFSEDRRFVEASRLVMSGRMSVARCAPEPDWSESDLLEAQKELVQIVAIRTLAVPAGRGPLYFSARHPLLTEKFPITGFNLSCVMKPSNNTVTADKSVFTEEKVGWAFFHSGVAAGLSISREAKGIDASWVVFNKPAELSNRHAGFLLALGLNGHLRSIAKWVAFKYLTPKHTMTSIGLLLGLSASYMGTMDTLITKLLSVHVSRMLPPGAAELNLSPVTQTTGIMGIGLLYCNTQHRRMSEIMLSEIEHREVDDSFEPASNLRDEGYRLAAGFALGFINLGRGKNLQGLHDMHLVERLLAIAVGTKKVNLVHILDKSTAGATIAIALIFMKSHDAALAKKIDVPDTLVQFDYVRPDIFLLRTLAKQMIMWDDIQPSYAWIKDQLPREYRSKMKLTQIRSLTSHDLPFFNILAGLCFSIGLRFAGSGSIEVRNILGAYLDQFIRLCRLSALSYDQRLTRSTIRHCQDLLALSAATVMAGTGDLHVFRRLRSLHGRTDSETPYGSHLAAHMAIGVLFLGGGNFTFGTSNVAIASLICAFYPLFPTSILDNKSHLQAFRHFWVLAVEARCLVVRDVDSHRPVSMPVTVTLRDGRELRRNAPCLLPDLATIARVTTTSAEHWRVILDFVNNPLHLTSFLRTQTIYVRHRAAHDTAITANATMSSHAAVFRATLKALDDTETSTHPLEWILDLPSFGRLDRAERALVLPPDAGSVLHASTESTLVDARLMLERACLDEGRADRLRNLRLLFEWTEKLEQDAEEALAEADDGGVAGTVMSGGKWITREVVDRLRAAVWMMAREMGGDENG